MKLPNNSIGISDINKYRECGRKMQYQMRRWTEGEQPPEDQHPATMYGTIIHEAYTAIEKDDLSDDEAIQFSFDRFAAYLGPEDLEKLRLDLQTYRERDYTGVRTIANETEVRVPLLEWEGETIFFRAKIDRLYQRLDSPGSFIHVDYKSSKWQKSEEEVHKDPQMWSYNWIIHEFWPECDTLVQLYDQLRYGVVPTRKSEGQREEMREWLVRQVTAILKDEDPPPRFNEWCPWCPIKYDCPVIDRLAKFEVAAISELAPAPEPGEEPLSEGLDSYAAKLPDVQTAVKTLKAYEDRVKAVVKDLPPERREELGFSLSTPNFDVWDAAGLEAVHEVMGEEFYRLVKMSKRQILDYLKDDDRAELVLNLSHKEPGTPTLRPRRR